MKIPKAKMQLVIVDWIDSAGHHGWHVPDDSDEGMYCESAGFLYAADKIKITICSHRQKSDAYHNSDLCIPICSIQKIKVIKR